MFDSVDESKLHPPPSRRGWIERPRLVSALRAGAGKSVTLIAASAGYGKTTLVTQWLAPRSPPSLRAWVRLDAGDNDPVRLWVHLAAALERIGCKVDANASEFVATSGAAMITRVVPRLADALAARSEPLVIVLDDAHLLRSLECAAQLSALIERLPPNAHLILIARSDPVLRLGRLRVEGRLTEIRAGDLSFTADEAAQLLQIEGLDLSPDSIDELVARTEGWPAALYLAALALRDRDDPDDFVRGLSGNNRFIADYLSEEVLTRQEGEVRDFILDMSVFERFSAPLGDSVTHRFASEGLIRRLERTNLFVTALDSAGLWFRFHHLFGSFARGALAAENPERLHDLHLRGADWFSAHGEIDEAVHHALAAGDGALAADLVQRNWTRYFDAGRAETVRRWLRGFEHSPFDHEAPVAVTAAWLAALTGQQTELERRLEMLESFQSDGPLSDGPLPDGAASVGSAIAMIRGLFGYEGPEQILADSAAAVQLEANPASPWYALARTARGHGDYLVGELTSARGWLAEAANATVAPKSVRLLAFALIALCDLELGDVAAGTAMAKLGMDYMLEHSMEAMPSSLLSFTASGAAQLAAGDLAGALSILEEGLRIRRRIPGLTPWPLIHHLIPTISAAARANRRDLARQLLVELEELACWPDAAMAVTHARITRARADVENWHRPERASVGDPLTAREEQVLRRLRGSQSLREIAHDLYVSLNTVKTITSSIYRKLGAHSRTEAISIARSRGVI